MGDIARGGAGVLGRVILVAPDLDVDVFLRQARELSERASVVTVYASAQDRALKASRQMRDEPRVGEGGRVIADLEGIDVVEVDQWRWRWGALHEYHLENESVVEDLREVLSGPPHATGPRIIRH
jgi:esterase/lipase superfamily enzyme